VAGGDSAAIDFRVLGPVEAVRNGSALPLGGPRQRALLALLLVEAGKSVSADRLADELWQGRPPASASGTLQSYVSRLRAALRPEVALSSARSGYTLEVAGEQIDAVRFERLVAAGRETLSGGAVARAVERLQSALALWRGSPFAGVGEVARLVEEANRLEQLRLLALEARIEAELQLGASAELVEELEALLADEPYRERFWRQLMLALYRAGRQADALAAYGRARAILYEELGVEPGVELRALQRTILRHEVPPVRPPEEWHNLPEQLTTFVGRDRELADVERLLGEARLVTLTGVGGVGKTRLAFEAARRAVLDFPDGVHFLDFSAIADPGLVERELLAMLEAGGPGDAAPRDQLVTRLRETKLLLVLDNCEHLREPIGELVEILLAACRHLRVLATSRETLRVPGEVDYLVPPLGLPAADAGDDELRASEAVRLFLTRARETSPRLREDAAALSSAGRICRDLDGLPLALELAAARAKALSLDDIAGRVADRFRFLVSWRRLATARHRTLRATMDWSYDLLDADEQSLLSGLSVFAGGFTLDAVSAVCIDGDEAGALALVERLVEASLLIADTYDSPTRYRLLETVREYAAGRLATAGAADRARERHAAYYLELAERHAQEIFELGTFARADLAPDDANLRAALRHLEASRSEAQELRLVAALWRYWWRRGEVAEGRQQLEAALAHGAGEATAARAEALRGASTLALRQGDHAAARALAENAVELSTRLDDVELARSRVSLGNAVGSLGDSELADVLYEQGAAAFRAADRKWALANVLLNMSDLALNRGDLDAAERIASESLALNRALGEEAGVALNLGNLAFTSLERGDADRAEALLVEAIGLAYAGSFGEWVAIMLVGIAAVACARGADRRAVELLGASERLLEESGASLDSIEGRVHARTVATLRLRLGGEFDATLASGRKLAAADAVAIAMTC
jgi:predicted ATPase/DNA-binding SARP family transcriptional activator